MKKIQLRGNNGIDKIALVDDDFYEKASKYKYYYMPSGYAYRSVYSRYNQKKIYMHHEVISIRKGYMCDHINQNKLDNRRENLREVTANENAANKKKFKENNIPYKGVSKCNNVYRSKITVNRKVYHLGYYKNMRDAAIAYNVAATLHHGKFASLNNIGE